MEMLQLTQREYEEHANLVFNQTINFLHEKEFITDAQAEELAHHAIIMRKPSFFQRMKKFLKHGCDENLQNASFFIIVKERSLDMVNQTAADVD